MNDKAPGLGARRAAFRLLMAVLWQYRPLDGAINHAFKELKDPSDRALAYSIASHTLRRLPDLDAAIDACTRRALPSDARARLVLRMALVQFHILQTPPHAVIATSLPLVEGGPRRLVHGVLSRLMRENNPLPLTPLVPEPFASRWQAAYGEEASQAIAQAIGREPPLDLTIKVAQDTEAWAERLEGISLAPGCVRIGTRGAIDKLPGYEEGAWWAQDIAAQLPARLMRIEGGEQVADLCAAPGGKTMQLAAAGAHVTAVDSSEARLGRLRDNLSRTGLSAQIVCSDVLAWRPETLLDALLLDAPCSATGTVRRHPDVLHLKATRDLEPLLKIQADLLDYALTLLKPGGRMVYAVCSLEPEEGEQQIEALLKRRQDVTLDAVQLGEVSGLEAAVQPRGWVRTHPGLLPDAGGCDGFFIARLLKH